MNDLLYGCHCRSPTKDHMCDSKQGTYFWLFFFVFSHFFVFLCFLLRNVVLFFVKYCEILRILRIAKKNKFNGKTTGNKLKTQTYTCVLFNYYAYLIYLILYFEIEVLK